MASVEHIYDSTEDEKTAELIKSAENNIHNTMNSPTENHPHNRLIPSNSSTYLRPISVHREIMHEEKHNKIQLAVKTVFALIITVAVVSGILVIKMNEFYENPQKNQTMTFNSTNNFLNFLFNYRNFDVLTTIVSMCVLIILSLMHKGVPKIVSPWIRKDRLVAVLVFGRISIEIFKSLLHTFEKSEVLFTVSNDTTGFLLMKIIELLLITIRFYPILVAVKVKMPIVDLLSIVIMSSDMTSLIWKFHNSNYSDNNYSIDENSIKIEFNVTDNIIWIIHLTSDWCFALLISSYIWITFIQSTVSGFINIKKTAKLLNKKNFLSSIFRIENRKENVCEQYDVDCVNYVFAVRNANNNDNSPESKVEYPYRFSCRILSCHFVAIVLLYYSFITLCRKADINLMRFRIYILNIKSSHNHNNIFDLLLCDFSKSLCNVDTLKEFKTFILEYNINGLVAGVSCLVFFQCLGHVVWTLFLDLDYLITFKKSKTYSKHLNKLKQLSHSSIIISNFQYTSYFIGHLIWGFIAQYMIVLLIIVICVLIHNLGYSLKTYMPISLPIIIIIGLKMILNVIMEKYVLAKINLKSVNLYSYMSYWIDSLIGILYAIVRTFILFILNVFMLPNISYTLIGLQFRKCGMNHTNFAKFLYLEHFHTNSIMLVFCDMCLKLVEKKSIDNEFYSLELQSKTSRAVKRWHLCVMLLRNKSLIRYRRNLENAR